MRPSVTVIIASVPLFPVGRTSCVPSVPLQIRPILADQIVSFCAIATDGNDALVTTPVVAEASTIRGPRVRSIRAPTVPVGLGIAKAIIPPTHATETRGSGHNAHVCAGVRAPKAE